MCRPDMLRAIAELLEFEAGCGGHLPAITGHEAYVSPDVCYFVGAAIYDKRGDNDPSGTLYLTNARGDLWICRRAGHDALDEGRDDHAHWSNGQHSAAGSADALPLRVCRLRRSNEGRFRRSKYSGGAHRRIGDRRVGDCVSRCSSAAARATVKCSVKYYVRPILVASSFHHYRDSALPGHARDNTTCTPARVQGLPYRVVWPSALSCWAIASKLRRASFTGLRRSCIMCSIRACSFG